MAELITNSQFLESWKNQTLPEAILQIEDALITDRLADLSRQLQILIAQKIEVSGGDDWHDGSFRATDGEAKILAEKHGKLNTMGNLPLVEMPDADLAVVSLGSRVRVQQNGKFSYEVDIVGLSSLHDYAENNDDLEVASIVSPLGQALLAKPLHEEFSAQLGASKQLLRILEIIPSPDLKFE